MRIGSKIKKEREDKAMTKAELADKVGISQTYLGKIENNKSIPTIDVAARLAKILGHPTDYFIDEVLTVEELDKALEQEIKKLDVTIEPLYEIWDLDYKAKRSVLNLLRHLSSNIELKTPNSR